MAAKCRVLTAGAHIETETLIGLHCGFKLIGENDKMIETGEHKNSFCQCFASLTMTIGYGVGKL